jgi:hypothetical protein
MGDTQEPFVSDISMFGYEYGVGTASLSRQGASDGTCIVRIVNFWYPLL